MKRFCLNSVPIYEMTSLSAARRFKYFLSLDDAI